MSSAGYPQSNGHAERAVQSMKSLVKKTWGEGRPNQNELRDALLEWRNTPQSPSGLSPAQWLFGRTMRTHLPAHPITYDRVRDEDLCDAEGRVEEEEVRRKARYDERAQPLPELERGQQVVVQDAHTGLWDRRGEIDDKRDGGRSYEVKMENGHILLRNRRFLKPVVADRCGDWPGGHDEEDAARRCANPGIAKGRPTRQHRAPMWHDDFVRY